MKRDICEREAYLKYRSSFRKCLQNRKFSISFLAGPEVSDLEWFSGQWTDVFSFYVIHDCQSLKDMAIRSLDRVFEYLLRDGACHLSS